ncbi:hypothetical protein MJ923_20560 [Shewanella sp. 3B26]|uniref:Uncharacterized protein n=1 Tax=Shewanella zhuhaiensis TaxID=2919576 RepID=A0AAJ1BL25_9GAMM|nr:hypothetical protein [Shewanella zhuhaiensis]MCH4296700.1 hypothetical protein [Shewanella zhuhaiensis]
MDTIGYSTKEEVLELVDACFPYIEKPDDDSLYVFPANDPMRTILHKQVREIKTAYLSNHQLNIFYDELGTLSANAVQWMFPSLIRSAVLSLPDEDTLAEALVCYFENANFEEINSAYNFSWLTPNQAQALSVVLEHISQETDMVVSLAMENVAEFSKL